MHRSIRPALAAVAALLLAAPLASAQTPEAILERYNNAIDPKGLVNGLQGMKTTVTMEIPAAGMAMTVNTVAARPNLFVLETEIPGMGTMRQGFDGTTAWASDPMNGPRLITGQEAAALIDNTSLSQMRRTPDQFAAMAIAGPADVGGDAATCVKFTWKSGRESTDCFSNASGLLVKSITKQAGPQGEMEVEMFIKDYRDVNGIFVPHRVESAMMGMAMTMVTTSVEFGPQAQALFTLPAEIKALKP
jgi:hypothetical protein